MWFMGLQWYSSTVGDLHNDAMLITQRHCGSDTQVMGGRHTFFQHSSLVLLLSVPMMAHACCAESKWEAWCPGVKSPSSCTSSFQFSHGFRHLCRCVCCQTGLALQSLELSSCCDMSATSVQAYPTAHLNPKPCLISCQCQLALQRTWVPADCFSVSASLLNLLKETLNII